MLHAKKPCMADTPTDDLREADDAEADADGMQDAVDEEESSGGLSQRIENLRNQVRKRRSRKRVKRQSKQARENVESRRREERIENNNPQGPRESVAASLRQAKLVASELGVSTQQARGIIARGNEALAQGGEALERLDLDGDGDTDIFEAVEEGQERGTDLTPEADMPGEREVDAVDMTDLQTPGEEPVDEVDQTPTVTTPGEFDVESETGFRDPNAQSIEDDLGL